MLDLGLVWRNGSDVASTAWSNGAWSDLSMSAKRYCLPMTDPSRLRSINLWDFIIREIC